MATKTRLQVVARSLHQAACDVCERLLTRQTPSRLDRSGRALVKWSDQKDASKRYIPGEKRKGARACRSRFSHRDDCIA